MLELLACYHPGLSFPQAHLKDMSFCLFFTNSCRSTHENRHIWKYVDDRYNNSFKWRWNCAWCYIGDFTTWCTDFFLSIHTSKIKDMFIDYRKSQSSSTFTKIILDLEVKIVTEYKLGTVIENKLSFESNTDAVCTKVQQPSLLRTLSSFKVCTLILNLFYQCFLESVLYYCVAWFGFLTLSSKNRLMSQAR